MRIHPTALNRPEMPTQTTPTVSLTARPGEPMTANGILPADVVSLASLTSQTMQLPEVRKEKVEKLKEKIASGKYHVDPKDVADAILKGCEPEAVLRSLWAAPPA